MGTNYYLEDNSEVCECCGRGSQRLHIGKSSGGWCFGLHVDLDEGIKNLSDWVKLWNTPGAKIKDEYDREVEKNEMMKIITERSHNKSDRIDDQWYRENNAEPGPNNLARRKIGPYCSGHGEGTWDLIPGEFS